MRACGAEFGDFEAVFRLEIAFAAEPILHGRLEAIEGDAVAGFEQAIIGSARPAERREMPPRGMDPHDSPQVVRYFNNYWVAPADVPWALLKFDN